MNNATRLKNQLDLGIDPDLMWESFKDVIVFEETAEDGALIAFDDDSMILFLRRKEFDEGYILDVPNDGIRVILVFLGLIMHRAPKLAEIPAVNGFVESTMAVLERLQKQQEELH